MSSARIVVQDTEFRIVRIENDRGDPSHVVEVPDTPDALGNERWRSLEMKNIKPFAMFLTYILRHCVEGERDAKDI